MSGSLRKRVKYSVPLLPLQHICKFVDLCDLYAIRLVSHKWCRLVSVAAIWEKYLTHITSHLIVPFDYSPWTQLAQILCIGNIEPEQMCKYFSRQDRYKFCLYYIKNGHHLYCESESPLQFYNYSTHRAAKLDIETCTFIEDKVSYPIMSIVKQATNTLQNPWYSF